MTRQEETIAIFQDSIHLTTRQLADKYKMVCPTVTSILSRKLRSTVHIPEDLLERSQEARIRRRFRIPDHIELTEEHYKANAAGRKNAAAKKTNSLMPVRYQKATPAGIAWLNLEPGPMV